MTPIIPFLALAALALYIQKTANLTDKAMRNSAILESESKIPGVPSVGTLYDARYSKGEIAYGWALRNSKAGLSIIVPAELADGYLPNNRTVQVYAVHPSLVSEITKSGRFLEYRP